MKKQYFKYRIKYQEDNIHFNTPFDLELSELSWKTINKHFVCQNWEDIVAYLDFNEVDETYIRNIINSTSIYTDYNIIEMTVNEVQDFINISFWDNIIKNNIIWDTIDFEVLNPINN